MKDWIEQGENDFVDFHSVYSHRHKTLFSAEQSTATLGQGNILRWEQVAESRAAWRASAVKWKAMRCINGAKLQEPVFHGKGRDWSCMRLLHRRSLEAALSA